MSIYYQGWIYRFLDTKNQPQEIQDYLRRENELLLQNIEQNTSAVDFGCGCGRHLELLGTNLRYGLGFDIVGQYIKIGTERLKKYPNLKLMVSDARNAGLHNNKFDYSICMNNTLGNIEEQGKVVSEMRRVILPNGLILAGVYSEKSIDSRIGWYERTGLTIEKVTKDQIITQQGFKSEHFSRSKLSTLFGNCSIEDIAGIGYLAISAKT